MTVESFLPTLFGNISQAIWATGIFSLATISTFCLGVALLMKDGAPWLILWFLGLTSISLWLVGFSIIFAS